VGQLSRTLSTIRVGRPMCCGSIPGRDKRFSSSPQFPDRLCDRTGVSFQAIRRLKPEGDHSPLSTANVEIAWSVFMEPCLIKQGDNCITFQLNWLRRVNLLTTDWREYFKVPFAWRESGNRIKASARTVAR
jgi:hypothetical protein